MRELIALEQLPSWVPGALTLDTAALGWDGVRVREFHYSGLDVAVPGLQDYLVVVYKAGDTVMNRRCEGPWQSRQIAPGSVSLLPQAVRSHWHWVGDIDVCHVYLPGATVAKVASDAYEREIRDVALRDVLRVDDPFLEGMATLFTREARAGGLGGRLYAEALRNQTCIHLLRHYAEVNFAETAARGGLSALQCRRLMHYIEDNLDQDIVLADLARVAGLSVFHFTRKFGAQFGCPPHAYVMRQRLERAKRQLANPGIPLKAVAANCGFADQSHMTRLFRKVLNATPAGYRRCLTG